MHRKLTWWFQFWSLNFYDLMITSLLFRIALNGATTFFEWGANIFVSFNLSVFLSLFCFVCPLCLCGLLLFCLSTFVPVWLLFSLYLCLFLCSVIIASFVNPEGPKCLFFQSFCFPVSVVYFCFVCLLLCWSGFYLFCIFLCYSALK